MNARLWWLGVKVTASVVGCGCLPTDTENPRLWRWCHDAATKHSWTGQGVACIVYNEVTELGTHLDKVHVSFHPGLRHRALPEAQIVGDH